MATLLTLVNTHGLKASLEAEVAAYLDAQGIGHEKIRSSREVLEWRLEEAVSTVPWQEWEADVAIQPEAYREKGLLVSDMEMTLVENEFLDDIAALIGVGEAVSAITARAMNGELDFADSLRARVALLKGQPASLLEQAWEGMKWMPGSRELVKGLADAGVKTVIVSGGFQFFARRVTELLGAAEFHANDLEIVDGKITGEVIEPVLGKETKREILLAQAQELGLVVEKTMAVGDGANDLPMLQQAGLGVSYHAKPAVAAAAGCRVVYSDLRALLAFAGLA